MKIKGTFYLVIALGLLRSGMSDVCYVGRDFDPATGRHQWVVPAPDLCQCTALRLGGDLRVPHTLIGSLYHIIGQLLLSENADQIWSSFNCTAKACARLPGQWEPFGHHCYLIVNLEVSYTTAEERCQDEVSSPGGSPSAHLASIHSAEENAFVVTYYKAALPNKPESMWIGYDRMSSGDFNWKDGSPNGYEDWKPDEPNGGSAEECVVLWEGTQWNDWRCSGQAPFICKIPAH